MTAPLKPSRLSLWMDKHGQPNQLTVDYVQTGTDTAETQITFTITARDGRKTASITVADNEFGTDRWNRDKDVHLHLDHATLLDWTEEGRKRLEEWKRFNKAEARDLAEYERLKKKFAQPARS